MAIANVDMVAKWLSIGTALVGGFIAVIKLRLYGILTEAYRTEIESHCQTVQGSQSVDDEDLFIWADYTITNIGDLPFVVRCVSLDLCRPQEKAGGHLIPDKDSLIVPTTFLAFSEHQAALIGKFDASKHHFKRFGSKERLGKGERTIFTLRCRVKRDALPEVFFIVGRFWRSTWLSRPTEPSSFSHMHIREYATTAAITAQAIGHSAAAR
jgi:hypothetical protein